MITFSAALLKKQDIPLQGAEPPELLELEDDLMFIAESPVTYDLVARKVSGGAMITGKAVTTLSGACGRCLEPTEIVLSTGDLQLFVEFENEEIVDITDDIRAELLINLPANLLCSEDCAGLCPVCGCNRNETICGCELLSEDLEAPADDEPSPWDALDKLKLDK